MRKGVAMGATWLVCAGEGERAEVCALVGRLVPGCQTIRSGDPVLARSLASGLDPAPCVAVGAGLTVDPVYVAAAGAADSIAALGILSQPAANYNHFSVIAPKSRYLIDETALK